MLGRCEEADEDFAEAEKSYKTAIENGASQRVEAIQRRANLLRGPLKQADEADRIIDKMVSDDPENDQVYLARGRYRRRFRLPGADADFRRVLKSTNGAEVYLELAELAAAGSNFDEARRVLQSGLAVAPKDPMLHQAQATLELRSGSVNKAIASLNKSLGTLPDDVGLRWMLANLLAEQGKTTELMDQIQELRRLGFTPTLLEFLEASHEVNSSQWTKAIQSLSRLQPMLEPMPELKARVNTLLARCYDQQGDPERLRDALQRAVRANPNYLPARLALISNQVERGELNQAIEESRKLVQAAPATRTRLIELLIVRNRQQPEERRDWREVEELLKQEAAAFAQVGRAAAAPGRDGGGSGQLRGGTGPFRLGPETVPPRCQILGGLRGSAPAARQARARGCPAGSGPAGARRLGRTAARAGTSACLTGRD